MVLPFVHQIVGVLWIFICDFSVNEVGLGNIVVGGFVSAKFRFDKQAVAGALSW
jgi:hypothetical protein